MLGLIAAGIGALTAGAKMGTDLYNSHKTAKEARSADARQYEYLLKSAKELPSAQRKGILDAGYNPMLALGNIGGSSAMASHSGSTNLSFDGSSAKAFGDFINDLMKDKAKAEVDNIKADTELKKGQLSAAESQRLQNEAETTLLHSQAERSDLAYGRDIVDTVTGIAGTAGSLYSAKAMSDIAKQNAQSRARNAATNERRLNQHSYEVRRDRNGHRVGTTERVINSRGANPNFNSGMPAVDSSAKGSPPVVAPHVGSSAKSAGSVAKELGKRLLKYMSFGGALALPFAPVATEKGRKYYNDTFKSERQIRKRSKITPLGF